MALLLLLLILHVAGAQTSVLIPIVDGVYHDPITGSNTVVVGYVNTGANPRSVSRDGNNYFDPEPSIRSQPTSFLPGIHHNVFTTDMTINYVSWYLFGVSATGTWNGVYDAPVTYQGRLSLNGEIVNGLTDFRFALYDSVTNGSQVAASTRIFEQGATTDQGGSPITVSNGLFTARLNFQSITINFSPGFSDTPAVTATGANGANCSWNLLTAGAVTIYTAQANGSLADAYFNFIAIGPL